MIIRVKDCVSARGKERVLPRKAATAGSRHVKLRNVSQSVSSPMDAKASLASGRRECRALWPDTIRGAKTTRSPAESFLRNAKSIKEQKGSRREKRGLFVIGDGQRTVTTRPRSRRNKH